jgi:hypothetical protein
MKPILPFFPKARMKNRRCAPVIGRSSDLQAGNFPTGRRFPVRVVNQCVITAVVPAYRCGTVPDSHRIPLADNERRLARALWREQSQIRAADYADDTDLLARCLKLFLNPCHPRNPRQGMIQPNPHMEAKDGQRQLICESCGASFGCCPVPNSGCWCASVVISDDTRADLQTKFSECICPACLAKYAQKEPAARA